MENSINLTFFVVIFSYFHTFPKTISNNQESLYRMDSIKVFKSFFYFSTRFSTCLWKTVDNLWKVVDLPLFVGAGLLRFGHTRGLTSHCDVIQDPRAASLRPRRSAYGKFNQVSRLRTVEDAGPYKYV